MSARTHHWKSFKNIIMAWDKGLTASNSGLLAECQRDGESKEIFFKKKQKQVNAPQHLGPENGPPGNK